MMRALYHLSLVQVQLEMSSGGFCAVLFQDRVQDPVLVVGDEESLDLGLGLEADTGDPDQGLGHGADGRGHPMVEGGGQEAPAADPVIANGMTGSDRRIGLMTFLKKRPSGKNSARNWQL